MASQRRGGPGKRAGGEGYRCSRRKSRAGLSAEPKRVGRDGVAVFTLSGTGIDEDKRLAEDARELVKVFRVDGAGRRGRVRTVRDLHMSLTRSVFSRISLQLEAPRAVLTCPETVTTREGGAAPFADPA